MLSIKGSLRVGFSVLLIFILAESLIVSFVANKNRELVSDAINKNFNSSLLISRIAIEGNKMRRYEKEFFIYAGNIKKMVKYTGEWEDSYKNLKDMLTAAIENEQDVWSTNDIIELRKWDESLEAYAAGFRQVVTDVRSGKLKGTLAANAAIKDGKNAFRVLLNGASKRGETKFRSAQNSAFEIEENNEFLLYVLAVIAASGVLLAIMLLVRVPGAVIRHTNLLSDAASTIGKGNLSVPVPVESASAEFRRLAEILEQMRLSQRSLAKRIKNYEAMESMNKNSG